MSWAQGCIKTLPKQTLVEPLNCNYACSAASAELRAKRLERRRQRTKENSELSKLKQTLGCPKVRIFPKQPHPLLPNVAFQMRRINLSPTVIRPIFARHGGRMLQILLQSAAELGLLHTAAVLMLAYLQTLCSLCCHFITCEIVFLPLTTQDCVSLKIVALIRLSGWPFSGAAERLHILVSSKTMLDWWLMAGGCASISQVWQSEIPVAVQMASGVSPCRPRIFTPILRFYTLISLESM